MLVSLSVNNLAIVEHVEASFGAGLNVITGETGAGKSVLMGALELALGARADATAVRDGAREARIEAEFDGVPEAVGAILGAAGLPPCEGGVLVVRRIVSAAGGGRVFVNDAPATVQTLRELGRLLVDLHGPNDHQSLLEEDFQRRTLDSYAKPERGGGAKAAYDRVWAEYTACCAEIGKLKSDSSDPAAEVDLIRYQLDEIESLALSADDEEELVRRHAACAHAAELSEASSAAVASLSGDGSSACEALFAAENQLRIMARHHPLAAEWLGRVESAVTEIQDIASSVEDEMSRIDADPETFAQLDERLSAVNRLKRKYAPTVAGILEYAEEKRRRLAAIESRGERLAELEKTLADRREALGKAGEALGEMRSKAAKKLAAAVTAELRGLGFLQADFGIALRKTEPSQSGCDSIEFVFAPNPGERARPLKAIASTGEIARVMLAIKTVLSAHDAIPTLVFDEIDSNIGGETGRAVGERLRAVAARHQVLAITHLPQSAVFGERHLKAEKTVRDGRTRTVVRELGGEERVAEIARMLGGAGSSQVVFRHARELVDSAQS